MNDSGSKPTSSEKRRIFGGKKGLKSSFNYDFALVINLSIGHQAMRARGIIVLVNPTNWSKISRIIYRNLLSFSLLSFARSGQLMARDTSVRDQIRRVCAEGKRFWTA